MGRTDPGSDVQPAPSFFIVTCATLTWAITKIRSTDRRKPSTHPRQTEQTNATDPGPEITVAATTANERNENYHIHDGHRHYQHGDVDQLHHNLVCGVSRQTVEVLGPTHLPDW